MPQEVIDRVDHLGKADNQMEMLTFHDRKGLLIGASETPGVPASSEETPEEDYLEDLNPHTTNQNYG